jgi:hypothetical protein
MFLGTTHISNKGDFTCVPYVYHVVIDTSAMAVEINGNKMCFFRVDMFCYVRKRGI